MPRVPRAVLDNSVLVSAFVTPRRQVAGLLLEPVRSRYRLCLSVPILEETAKKLLKKERLRGYIAYPDDDVRDYIDWLSTNAELVANLPEFRIVPGDLKDDMVIATAVAAKADYLVTGDRKHLIPLDPYGGIRIVTPRQFLDLI